MKFKALIHTYMPLFWQIFRFGIVGLLAASVHFTTVIGIVSLTTLKPLAANVFGYVIGFQISYWGHRTWTFQDNITSHREAYSKLVLVQTIGFGLNELLFFILLSLNLPYPIALLIVLATIPIFTFLSSKMWVFA